MMPQKVTVNIVYNDLLSVNVIQNTTQRPLVESTFKNTRTMGLYDTGSCVTCMSETDFRKLHPSECILMPAD